MMLQGARRRSWLVSGIWFGLLAAGFVAIQAGLVYRVSRPFHSQGYFQPLTGLLNRLDYLLQFPGTVVDHYLRLHLELNPKGSAWLFRVGLNMGLYFAAGFLLRVLWRWAAGHPAAPTPAPGDSGSSDPRPLTAPRQARRRFLITGMKIAGGSAAAGLGYSFLVEPRWFGVSNQVIPIRGLHSSLDGLRLVQLTDIHHGPWLSLGYVREVVRAANDLKPDLVLLTGDYISESRAYIQPVISELGRLQPLIATVAVLGNHDWWHSGPLIRQELARVGIPVIDNTRRVLTPERRLVHAAGEGLALCGVGDLWTDQQLYQQALGRLPEGMPRLLLSHNPDVAEERALVQSRLRVDLMISGHTHGGQVFIPTLGTPIVPSRYGQKYAQGLVQGPVCPVFVCRGVGETVLPLRVGVPPEIAVLELRAVPRA
jgi:uncharacterized protein